jgi:hypothetical protein
LGQWRSIEAAGNKWKLLVHMDNARPYIAKLSTQYFNENRMKSAPHPPYSPDLAPSDFCRKSELANGLSWVDGPIKEMYRYQLGVYWVNSNKRYWGMEFYPADIEMLVSGWNTLYILVLIDAHCLRDWIFQ